MKPLKFNNEMLQLVINGQKTQTRRLITGFDVFEPYESGFWRVSGPSLRACYDEETSHKIPAGTYKQLVIVEKYIDRYCPYGASSDFINFHDAKGYPIGEIFLRHIRVERLQDISEQDAISEGMRFTDYGKNRYNQQRNGWSWKITTHHDECLSTARFAFGNLWESFYGEYSWDANPWVWVIDFRMGYQQ
ncbi:hypothetical protein [Xenorhabdus szentirmaii]|uniref:hypothetical protein n=1 Tax=Xenorhabdus szentirmaii TaxID=290112 RepID=UPI001985D955|nr:hypothetical protein [Xenorhabdus sp. 5]MBD2827185.1 ASCH domain-containing protein [Xenorhabdus sp. 5]